MPTRQRRIDVAPGLRDRSHEAAWKRRTTISALVRESLTRFVKNGVEGARLSRNDPGSGPDKIRIWIDDSLWEAAIEQATADGVSIASVIRRSLERINELEKV